MFTLGMLRSDTGIGYLLDIRQKTWIGSDLTAAKMADLTLQSKHSIP